MKGINLSEGMVEGRRFGGRWEDMGGIVGEKMKLSVIVPVHNSEKTLPVLLDSLSRQSYTDFEVIVIDDCSQDNTCQVAKSFNCIPIQLTENHGPAYCRNIGARSAQGDILVFTDSDCMVGHDWLDNIQRHFSHDHATAVTGRLVLTASTFLGDSISALGFPAGGAIGFDKIWKVDQNGFTDSLSTCNCAIKKNVFWEIGGFDESFPFPGGEDSLLAYNLRKLNFRIKYCPDVLAYHSPRESLLDFVRWQFRRGISSYLFSKKVSNKMDFGSLRIWSTSNIIRHHYADKKFPLILFLLGTSFIVQLMGFLSAKSKKEFNESLDHKPTVAG